MEKEKEKEEKENNSKVPQVFKRFKRLGRKGPPRVTYTYDYSKDEGSRKQVLVAPRVARKGPDSLIDLLIAQKLNIYEREERMRLLKEQTDADWRAMEAENHSSDEEVAD